MTVDDAVKTTTRFLKRYVTINHWFTPEEDRDDESDEDGTKLTLSFWKAVKDDDDPKRIWVFFIQGARFPEGAPEIKKLADQCLDALLEKHPEIASYKLDVHIKH